MNLKNKIALVLLGILLLFNCSKEDESEVFSLEFLSFKVIENNENIFETEAELKISGLNSPITNHGVDLFYNDNLIERFDQGVLEESVFRSQIFSGMFKGTRYNIRPYIIYEGNEYYGDLISFKSNLQVDIIVSDISPLSGFVGDTITIKGDKFCENIDGIRNSISLGGFYQNIISESDSLIVGVISPYADKSTAKFSIESCRTTVSTDFEFVFDAPEIDSISTEDYYVGDKSKVYGKKIHPAHTRMWIDTVEVDINKERDSITDLEFFIPKNLPSGSLDVKLEIIDRVIELKQVYQSTSPEITEIDKLETGFLDIITITGNYLVQPNSDTKVYIGEKEQTIVSISDKEIKVKIDQYFSVTEPKLKLTTGDFEIEKDIVMLPPEIVSINKEYYHLQDDSIEVETKYFLGNKSHIKIGGVTGRGYGVDNGNFILSIGDWLSIKNPSQGISFVDKGKLQLQISTPYGEVTKDINIHAPVIESLDKEDYIYDELIKIKGNDFGYGGVTDVFINDERLPFGGNSSYKIGNKEIYFPISDAIHIGTNTLKVITGGQESNSIDFNIKKVIPQGLSFYSGTRKDSYEIIGENLTGKVFSNGSKCEIIESTSDRIKFELPYYKLFTEDANITLQYGPHTYDIGVITGIEPYEKKEGFIEQNYTGNYTHFEYKGEFYMLTSEGVFKLNISSYNWDFITSDVKHTRLGIGLDTFYSEGKIYFPLTNGFRVYDFENKKWEDTIELNISDDLKVWYATVYNNIAYIITSSSGYKFYAYNLETNELINLPQPKKFPEGNPTTFNIVNHFKTFNGRIYLEMFGTIQMFDVENNYWSDLGFPGYPRSRQHTSLYEYKGVLYSSGGILNASNTYYDIHAYDLQNKQWSEKTYMPSMLSEHSIFGQDNKLYIFSGRAEYRYSNPYMYIYNIEEDPH